MTTIYAGHLCGTHVGEYVSVGDGSTGWLHSVIHRDDRVTVRLVLTIERVGRRVIDVDPREVITIEPTRVSQQAS